MIVIVQFVTEKYNMTNGNDQVEHIESCDFCLEVYERYDKREITDKKAAELQLECFNNSLEAE